MQPLFALREFRLLEPRVWARFWQPFSALREFRLLELWIAPASLQAFSRIYNGDELVDASSVFGENCDCAIAAKVTDIPRTMFDQTLCVRAYTIAEDGTVSYGMPRAVTVSSLESQTS